MKKLKKTITLILTFTFLISTVIVSGCIGSCINDGKMGEYSDPWKYRQIEGEFYYYIDTYRYEQDSAVILGLVDEEKEIEELVIPETLGGCPVVAIGGSFATAGLSREYAVNAKNVKKIIINHDVYLCSYGVVNFEGDLILNTKLSRNNFYIWYDVDFDYYAPGKYNEVYSGVRCVIFKYMCSEEEINFGSRCYCYIDFELNGGKQSVFAVKVLKTNTMPEIEEPTKTGYEFGGWYKEETLENEWNFEDIVTEDMTLYAKWIEK